MLYELYKYTTPAEALEMTPNQAHAFIDARRERENESVENIWRIVRWHTAMVLNLYAKKGSEIKDPTELFLLPSEKTDPTDASSFDDPRVVEMWERWDREERQKYEAAQSAPGDGELLKNDKKPTKKPK